MMRATKFAGVFAVVLSLAATAQADETKGTIKTVDTTRKEVVLKGIVSDSVYLLNKDATIWLDGFRCKLTDLHADDRAAIAYQKSGDHLMAKSVRGLRKAEETTGMVQDVLGEKREVTLRGTVKNSTYELVKGGTVWINNKKGALSDIRVGDEVLITFAQRGDRLMANDVTVYKRK